MQSAKQLTCLAEPFSFRFFQTFSRMDREHSSLLQRSILRDKSKLCDN